MTEEVAAAKHVQQSQAELLHLHDTLDHVWIRYLECLDVYQDAQAELGKLMSAGFFSLAQANFKSTDRRRYGKDYYDERMKASSRFHIKKAAETFKPSLEGVAVSSTSILESASVALCRSNDSTPRPSSKPPAEENHDPNQHVATSDDDVATVVLDGKQDRETETNDEASEPDVETPTRDPLTCAMDGALLQALNAAIKLRDLEAEIRVLRKSIKNAEKTVDI